MASADRDRLRLPGGGVAHTTTHFTQIISARDPLQLSRARASSSRLRRSGPSCVRVAEVAFRATRFRVCAQKGPTCGTRTEDARGASSGQRAALKPRRASERPVGHGHATEGEERGGGGGGNMSAIRGQEGRGAEVRGGMVDKPPPGCTRATRPQAKVKHPHRTNIMLARAGACQNG